LIELQIDALLPSVRPKESRKAPLENFLMHLHGFLSNLPTVESMHPLRAAEKLSSLSFHLDYPPSTPVTVPYSQPWPTEATNWKVGFEKPSEITLVGSWPTHTSVRGQDNTPFAVDLSVEMPSVSPFTRESGVFDINYISSFYSKKRITSMAASFKSVPFILLI
jgi:U3 small nucleolar RNA-associated protein 22